MDIIEIHYQKYTSLIIVPTSSICVKINFAYSNSNIMYWRLELPENEVQIYNHAYTYHSLAGQRVWQEAGLQDYTTQIKNLICMQLDTAI